ncbi:hypothetical protein [Lactiplantibacillus modestisalitolerans]|uniref:Uncharacterized protein n=1 Tax=Lactiplantibacillus modestisalitolerans TaxID=1457219 RepID=A0ABV5WT84_9LACO|nr:hypothetical protein [Lactiplantibacillus modestisalitolerans]
MERKITVPYENQVQHMVKGINESQSMELNKNDYIFILLIAGLQVARQYINKSKILNRARDTDQEAAKKIKHNEKIEKTINGGDPLTHKSVTMWGNNSFLENISVNKQLPLWVLGPTSYDAIRRSSAYWEKTGVSGMNHRYTTLAHDPLIGLVVGPINLLSNTITYNTSLKMGTSYTSPFNTHNPATGYEISRPSSFSQAVYNSIAVIKKDKTILAAAIIKHLLHLASDINTKQGLTIPGMSMLPSIGSVNSRDIDKWLISNHFDFVWFADLFAQYGLAELINVISSILYKFLIYRDTDKDIEFIDAKCKKVIAIANAVSASEDLIVAAIKASTGHVVSALRELDWGGLVAAIKRMFASDEFMLEVKGISESWDAIQFNFKYSTEDVEQMFQNKIKSINNKYEQILLSMQKEYRRYGELEALATNFDQVGDELFSYSIQFAQLNNVHNSLKNKKDIDNFFNN